jgi:DNA-binding IscR family transcriptional regulator
MTVGQVVRALEGEIAPVECLTLDYLAGTCVREPGCLSRPVWQRVKESVEQVLDSLSLADLSAEEEARGHGDTAMRAPSAAGAPLLPMTGPDLQGDDSCFVPTVN